MWTLKVSDPKQLSDFVDMQVSVLLPRVAAFKPKTRIAKWFKAKYMKEAGLRRLCGGDFVAQKAVLVKIVKKINGLRYADSRRAHRDLGWKSKVIKKIYKQLADEIGPIFLEAYEALDKADFVEKKGLRVCPYCGRSYIYMASFDKAANGKIVKPQIDHFLNKDRYPMFAVNYFNLIPSCPQCNMSPCKGTNDVIKDNSFNTVVMHPYEFDDTQLTFKAKINKADIFKASSFEISIASPYHDGYEHLFGLESLYKLHDVEARDLWLRKMMYNSISLDYLMKLASKDHARLELLHKAMLGYYRTGLPDENTLLSKFYRDIRRSF